MSMYVGRIGKDDVDTILNLNDIIFHDQITYSKDYITEICNKKNGYIVRFDDIPVGYVFCDMCHNDIPKKSVPTIMSIGVLEEYRRLGIARTLLRSSLELYPVEDMYLCVREKNPNAQNLYSSEGFIVIGTIPKYYKLSTGNEDAYVMVKFHEVNGMLF